MGWQCSSCIIAICMYRFVCLLWLKLLLQVEAYWFVVVDLLKRTRSREFMLGWYFSKHFLYKIISQRIINPPLFSFTVNSPGLTCCCWIGIGVTYQMAMYEKKEGISDHPIALSSRELRKWKWPSAGPRRARRLLSPPPGHSSSTSDRKSVV